MSHHGSAVLSLMLDADGFALADPQLSTPGLLSDGPEDEELIEIACDVVLDAIEDLSANKRRDDVAVREVARKVLRKFFRQELGKKPLVDVHLMRGKE
jgi:ribonuclease J